MGFWSSVKSYFSPKSSPAPSTSTSTSSPTSSSSSGGTTTTTSSSTPSTSSGGGSTSTTSTTTYTDGRLPMTTGSTTTSPTYADPIKSIDYVDSSGAGAGAITLSGTNVWKSSGGGGSSSSGTSVLSSTFSPKITTSLTGTAPTSQTKVLAPKDTRTTAKRLDPYTGLPVGASSYGMAPSYYDPIRTEKTKLADYNRMSLGQNIKQGWVGNDGYQITDTFNLLGGLQGGVGYFSDTYGGSKPIPLQDSRYPAGGTGILNTTTGEFYSPKTDSFTKLRTKALLNPDLSQPAGQVSQRKKDEVIAELTPKYTNLASGATSQAEIDKINKQFEIEATNLYTGKIAGLDKKRQGYSSEVYGANVNAPSGLITTGAILGATFIGGIPAVTASYLISGQGLKTGFEGAREGDIGKTALGALQFGVGGYYGAKGTANLVTQGRIKALTNIKPSTTFGSRTIKGDVAIDKGYYTRNTAYGSSTTNTLSITKVGSKGQFGGIGSRSDIINVKDAWSGKNIILQNTNFYGSSGQLLKTTSGGWTPSIYQTKSTGYQATYFKNTLRIDTTPVKTTSGAGRTYKIDGGYVFSQSGGSPKITSKDIRFSGANYFKDVSGRTTLGFNKDAVSLFKINKVSGFGGGSSGGSVISSSSGGGQTFSNINQISQTSQAIKLPSISQATKAISITKAVGGVSFGGIGGASLLSNVKAQTIQIPRVSTTPAIRGRQQLKIIPAIKTDTAIAPATSSSYSSGLTQIPAITQLPVQKIIQAQKVTPFSRQLAGSSGMGAFNLPSFGGGLVVPFKFPSIGADFGQLGKRRIKARRVTAYTPSFNALFYNIKGSKPRGIETGLRIRPVTKGFKFSTIFKKARKVRI